MQYKRLDKLFLILWSLIFSTLLHNSYNQNMKFVKVFDHYVVGITAPMLSYVTSKDQLAAVIAHEISHIQLGHTHKDKHNINMEYNADLLSFYYLKKAGFGICGAYELWTRAAPSYLSLSPDTHPNYQTRAYYMNMPECKNNKIKEEVLTTQDAINIFNRLNANVLGATRYLTRFEINYFAGNANAYAGERLKELK